MTWEVQNRYITGSEWSNALLQTMSNKWGVNSEDTPCNTSFHFHLPTNSKASSLEISLKIQEIVDISNIFLQSESTDTETKHYITLRLVDFFKNNQSFGKKLSGYNTNRTSSTK